MAHLPRLNQHSKCTACQSSAAGKSQSSRYPDSRKAQRVYQRTTQKLPDPNKAKMVIRAAIRPETQSTNKIGTSPAFSALNLSARPRIEPARVSLQLPYIEPELPSESSFIYGPFEDSPKAKDLGVDLSPRTTFRELTRVLSQLNRDSIS